MSLSGKKSEKKIYDELVSFVRKRGYSVTKEIRVEINQLFQMMAGQKISGLASVLAWLEEKRKSPPIVVKEIGVKDLEHWRIDSETGNISHKSGKFFKVIGVKASEAKGREVLGWDQPMMKQNECGILGILCQKRKGIMYYLMYAKCEPGSTVNPQLSPTLQATSSNLGRAHGGKKPLFAEYFENSGKGKVIVSVEQVEDPSRFYLKTNRCMIVEIPEKEKIEITEDFVWLTLAQIKKLLKLDLMINALARDVFGSL